MAIGLGDFENAGMGFVGEFSGSARGSRIDQL
jgi:hypothetical protein